MPISNVAKRRGKGKLNLQDKREALKKKLIDSYDDDLDVNVALIQELIPLGLKEVSERLRLEVAALAGNKYSRDGSYTRWGRQNGSVYLQDQKVPIVVPRIRDVDSNAEVRLKTYEKLQSPQHEDSGLTLKLLHGLSTHKYRESSSLSAEVCGLSASNLSKRFKRASTAKLKELQTRPLGRYDIVAVFIDAKRYADDGIITALGVTIEGRKVILGVEHIHSENSRAIEDWFDRLIERGFKYDNGLLFIIDGSKGIAKAIRRKFSSYAAIQRCKWHKKENVVSYLNDPQKVVFRRLMDKALGKTTYREAKADTLALHKELANINVAAANSLMEGLEEVLTIHKLGLSPELSKSLGTTNCIESVMSQMAQYTDKVDRWHNSKQILRWTATALLDIEPRTNKIKGYRYLPLLRNKLEKMVEEARHAAPERVHAEIEAGIVSD